MPWRQMTDTLMDQVITFLPVAVALILVFGAGAIVIAGIVILKAETDMARRERDDDIYSDGGGL